MDGNNWDETLMSEVSYFEESGQDAGRRRSSQITVLLTSADNSETFQLFPPAEPLDEEESSELDPDVRMAGVGAQGGVATLEDDDFDEDVFNFAAFFEMIPNDPDLLNEIIEERITGISKRLAVGNESLADTDGNFVFALASVVSTDASEAGPGNEPSGMQHLTVDGFGAPNMAPMERGGEDNSSLLGIGGGLRSWKSRENIARDSAGNQDNQVASTAATATPAARDTSASTTTSTAATASPAAPATTCPSANTGRGPHNGYLGAIALAERGDAIWITGLLHMPDGAVRELILRYVTPSMSAVSSIVYAFQMFMRKWPYPLAPSRALYLPEILELIERCASTPTPGEVCVICSEQFVESDETIKLECTHLFHRGCLITWLLMKGACPVCRGVVRDEITEQSIDFVKIMEALNITLFTRPGQDISNMIYNNQFRIPNMPYVTGIVHEITLSFENFYTENGRLGLYEFTLQYATD